MAPEADARAIILGRVRKALGGRPALAADGVAAAWEALPRDYGRRTPRTREETLLLLEDRLRDYDAQVERVRPSELVATIGRRLREHGSPRMVVPAGFPEGLIATHELTVDRGFSHEELDGFGGVLTTATLAIALTGTLVLQNVPGQGRRATTLIPDYHLCVVAMEDVVETVPQAMERLQGTAALATTFISGPSATADIEMTRIKGVHGPRILDVLLVEGGWSDKKLA